MSKLSFLIRFLVYGITNPKKGGQIIDAKYNIWRDSKVNHIHTYDDKESDLAHVIKKTFPDVSITIDDMQKNTKQIQTHINNFFKKLEVETHPSKKKPYPVDYTLDNKSGLFLYSLCKIIQPEVIVETGVAYGLSSMYILQALYENKKGTLYSLDSTFSPWQSKNAIGSAIPDHLRDRWEFIFGSSSEKLSEILGSLKSIDVFFHDSLHTHRNMMMEFEMAWPFIKNGGFLYASK